MGNVEFELRGEIFEVPRVVVRQVCAVLAEDPETQRCVVGSDVSADVFRLFLSAIEGNEVEITNKNIDDLSALCDESQFEIMLRHVRQNARIDALERQFQELLLQFQRQEASLQAVGQLKADVGALNSAVSCLGVAQFQSWATEINSGIVSALPFIFPEFRGKRFALLWRCGRDFHDRCDGRANTLTLVEDTNGNIFGGFTPSEWESRQRLPDGDGRNKTDASLRSFMFTLKNPHNIAARRFALSRKSMNNAIWCDSIAGPHFGDLCIVLSVSATRTATVPHPLLSHRVGRNYINDT
jgi:hypothetical protein